MKVLSLFDGISCGRIALDNLQVKIDKYYSFEIDKYAIKVSQANWNDIDYLGDIKNFDDWYKENDQPSIDLILCGSPCQGFSQASKDKLNFNHPQSKLFFDFVKILKQVKPKYFLLENVRMKKEWRDIISSYVGVDPILINSSIFSAQSRQRYYWTNIPLNPLPEDQGIVLKDILESGDQVDLVGKLGTKLLKSDIKKGSCLLARDYKGWNNFGMSGVKITTPIKKPIRVGTLNKGSQGDRVYSVKGKAITLSAQSGGTASNSNMLIQVGKADDIKGHDILKRIYSDEGKSPTLNTCSGGNREVKILDVRATRERRTEEGKRIRKENIKKGKDTNPFRAKETVLKDNEKANTLTTRDNRENDIQIETDNKFIWRRLSVLECERLQTVPDYYTNYVSKTQRLKQLGNGWNVKTIEHILKPITKED